MMLGGSVSNLSVGGSSSSSGPSSFLLKQRKTLQFDLDAALKRRNKLQEQLDHMAAAAVGVKNLNFNKVGRVTRSGIICIESRKHTKLIAWFNFACNQVGLLFVFVLH